MKDGGRIAAAAEVLADLERTRRPVADILKDWGHAHRFAGSGDRAAIGSLVFDALRRRNSLAAMMGADTPRALALAAYAIGWGRGRAGLEAALAGDAHAPAVLSEEECAALDSARLPEDAPVHVRADLPDWLVPSLSRAFGDRLADEGRAFAARAPVDLRVNTLKADRDAVLGDLAEFGAGPTPLSPLGVRIPVGEGDARAPHVQSEPGYKLGRFEIQDEGSQIAALLAAPAPGAAALDLCAGGGGKTLALSAAMDNAGTIHAFDTDKRRFGDIFDRLGRAGATNVDVRMPKPGALDDLAGRMDLVLIDAPCTGVGTWRRRPDAKWRLAPGALDLRLSEQRKVLAQGAGFARPGGTLVYVTCSVLPEENEDQVAAFLSAHTDFRLVSIEARWRERLPGAPPAGAVVGIAGRGTALRLTPANAGTDGFFVAVMTRG